MVSRTFSRADYEKEADYIKERYEVEAPKAGETKELAYGPFAFEVKTTLLDNDDVHVDVTVTKHPWFTPVWLIEKEMASRG